MSLDHKKKIEYEVLRLMCEDGVTNTREVVKIVVGKGHPQDDVLNVMLEMFKEGLFELKGPDGKALTFESFKSMLD